MVAIESLIIEDISYEVIIKRKKIKHTYIRVSDDLKIIITTSKAVTRKMIKELLSKKINSIKKMINRQQKKLRNNDFILGYPVDIVVVSNLKKPEFYNNKLYLSDKNKLEAAKKIIAKDLFKERLNYRYSLFKEEIPYPILKIRKMKTRWGVCNPQKETITLNLDLINKEIKYIDYVIVHELIHFIHANHSSDFWNLVAQYINDYKEIKRELRD